MPKHFIVFLFALPLLLFINSTSLAQDRPDADERLLVKFSKIELRDMNNEDLEFWNFYLDNSIVVKDIPVGKEDGIPLKLDLSPDKAKDVDILTLGLEPHNYVKRYYQLKDTNKMLMLYSIQDVKRLMTNND